MYQKLLGSFISGQRTQEGITRFETVIGLLTLAAVIAVFVYVVMSTGILH